MCFGMRPIQVWKCLKWDRVRYPLDFEPQEIKAAKCISVSFNFVDSMLPWLKRAVLLVFLACQVGKRCVFAQCCRKNLLHIIYLPIQHLAFISGMFFVAPSSKVYETFSSTCLNHVRQSPACHEKVPGRGRVPKGFICATNW